MPSSSPRPYGWLGTFAAMASPCEVHVAGADRETARAPRSRSSPREAWRVEDKFSRYRAGNIVHAINTADGRPVDGRRGDGAPARLRGRRSTSSSEGEFDITSGVLRKVWRFDGSDRVPQRASRHGAARSRRLAAGTWDVAATPSRPGMQIDFGGIGKEYAVDRAAAARRRRCEQLPGQLRRRPAALGPLARRTRLARRHRDVSRDVRARRPSARAHGRRARDERRRAPLSPASTASATATSSTRRPAGRSRTRRAP